MQGDKNGEAVMRLESIFRFPQFLNHLNIDLAGAAPVAALKQRPAGVHPAREFARGGGGTVVNLGARKARESLAEGFEREAPRMHGIADLADPFKLTGGITPVA